MRENEQSKEQNISLTYSEFQTRRKFLVTDMKIFQSSSGTSLMSWKKISNSSYVEGKFSVIFTIASCTLLDAASSHSLIFTLKSLAISTAFVDFSLSGIPFAKS